MVQRYNSTFEPCVRVYALGGLDESGKNMFAIETPDSIFLIEAGSKYPDLSDPGIDIIIPDFSFIEQHKEKVKAIIISHGHDDVYGALPYLLRTLGNSIPIYVTKTTEIIIRSDFGSRAKNFNFHIIKPSDDILISGYPFHFFETTHSVMESFGFSVETEAGSIVYTGNYISDFGSQGHFTFDLAKIAKIADEHQTLLMLSESSGAEKPGIVSPTHKLTSHIKSLIEEGDNRVIIACYLQNLYAINEIIKLAIANRKKICITNPKLLEMLPQFMANGDLVIPRANQCTIEEIPMVPQKDLIILITGNGEELFNSIIDLCHGENKHAALLHIEKDDVFVLAAPPAPSLEILATSAEDCLYKTDCKVISLKRKEFTSMHAQQEDIKMLVSIFSPKYFMPVSGDFRYMMANAKLAESLGYSPNNIFLLDNGMAINFDRAGNAITPVVQLFKPTSIFIDGLGVGDVKSNILEERTTMSTSGAVVLAGCYSSLQKSAVGEPSIELRGFVAPREEEGLTKQIKLIFKQFLDRIANDLTKKDELSKKFIDTIQQEMKKQTGKSPLVSINLIDLDS